MSAYEPGTVAVATVRGVKGVRVMRVRNLDGWVDENGYAHTPEGHGLDTRTPVTDVRPLVVLDPRDWANSADLSDAADWLESSGWNGSAKVLRRIVEQTQPARIEEPGLWGVVKATISESTYGRIWLRDGGHENAEWVAVNTHMRREWDHLIDPTLIREGVES